MAEEASGGREDLERLRLLVSGVVQGVGYRYSTVRQARRLALAGWVRNLGDGRVEILAEGRPEDLATLRTWCKSGPMGAVVRGVEAVEESVDTPIAGFDVRY